MSEKNHPDVIGGYKILNTIAERQWGAIYQVQPLELKRTYAMKVCEGDSSRLEHERDCLQKLESHPHIVTPYFAGSEDNKTFLVTEYVDENLRRRMETRRSSGMFRYQEIMQITQDILSGLAHAHKRGIVHLDLKPENVLLQWEGNGWRSTNSDVVRAKIADFGLARHVQDNRVEGSLEDITKGGTPDYAAPEQKMSGQKVDHRADIYAVGILLYEMLTGKIPDRNPEKPSTLAHSPCWLDDVIFKAFSQDPAKRYQSAQEMSQSLLLGIRGKLDIPVPPKESYGERVRKMLVPSLKYVAKTVCSLLKHAVLSPAHVVGAPIQFAHFMQERCEKRRDDHAWESWKRRRWWLTAAYVASIPFLADYALTERVKHKLADNPQQGTIVFYDSQQFHLIDARSLPEVKKTVFSAPGARAYTLCEDGKKLLYSTAKSVDSIDLASGEHQTLTTSALCEVMSAITNQKKADGTEEIFVQMKDEVWKLSNKRLQQTEEIVVFPTPLSGSGPFYLKREFLPFDSDLEIVLQGNWLNTLSDFDLIGTGIIPIPVLYSWSPVNLHTVQPAEQK